MSLGVTFPIAVSFFGDTVWLTRCDKFFTNSWPMSSGSKLHVDEKYLIRREIAGEALSTCLVVSQKSTRRQLYILLTYTV